MSEKRWQVLQATSVATGKKHRTIFVVDASALREIPQKIIDSMAIGSIATDYSDAWKFMPNGWEMI